MLAPDRRLLELDPWFGGLQPARRELVLTHGVVRNFKDGTRLYHLGDPPNGLHALLSGEVRLISYPSVGTELVGKIIRPGQWFGELSVIDGKGRPHDAVAVSESCVLTVTMPAIAIIARCHPEFWRDLALLSCVHQRAGLRDTGRVRSEPAIARLARFLVVAGKASGNGKIGMTQDEIAQIIGISRQYLNKLVRRLDSSGLVTTGYGEIRLMERRDGHNSSRKGPNP